MEPPTPITIVCDTCEIEVKLNRRNGQYSHVTPPEDEHEIVPRAAGN
jgi:hypothetical protein